MTTRGGLLKLLRIVAGIGVIALTLAGALPHQHESSQLSHALPCRACHLQEAFVATPPPPIVSVIAVVLADQPVAPSAHAPRAVEFSHTFAPRSPPASA